MDLLCKKYFKEIEQGGLVHTDFIETFSVVYTYITEAACKGQKKMSKTGFTSTIFLRKSG